MSNSNIETITREHDNFSSSYNELVNLLEKVITNRKITQDDKYDLEKAHATYVENYNDVKRILENEKEANLREQIKAVNDNKLDADINSIVNILTNNGEKNTLYLDEDGNLYIDGEKIPEIKQVKLTVDEQNGKIESLVSDGFVEEADGTKVKLKVAFSTMNQQVDKITTTVGQIEGVANDANSKADGALTKVSQVEQTVDGIKQTVQGYTTDINKGVVSVNNKFYVSDSKESLIGGSWSTTAPTTIPEGKYLWIRPTYTLKDGTTNDGTAVCASGNKGDKGVGIDHIVTIYYVSDSNTIAPSVTDDGWVLDIPPYPTEASAISSATDSTVNSIVGTAIVGTAIVGTTGGTGDIQDGKYLWSAYKIWYTDGTIGYTTPQYCSEWEAKYKAEKAVSIATQTMEKFEWIVQKGSTASSITLTDKAIEAIANSHIKLKANQITLEGIVTANGNFKILADGSIEAVNAKFSGDITGSTFTSKDGSFKVGTDGRAEVDSLSVNNEFSTDVLTVGQINNSRYQAVLDEDVTIYIDPSGIDSEEFVNYATFTSITHFMDNCPPNLNGHTLTLHFVNNVSENIVFDNFHSGKIVFSLNGKSLLGYMYLGGYGMQYEFAQNNNGKIMPNIAYSGDNGNYAIYVYNTSLRIQDCTVYGGNGSGNNSGIELCNFATGKIDNVGFVNCYNAVRGYVCSKAFISDTKGQTSSYTFYSLSGSVLAFGTGANASSTAGPSYAYKTSSNGQCWVDGGNFTSNAIGGSNTNTGTATGTKTVTLTADYGDTYRKTVYNNWKKDGTVRQGDYGYGDCVGCWFFGTKFSKYSKKNVSKIVITFTRQSGGVYGSVTHGVRTHNYATRPSGSPSFNSNFSKSVSVAVGNTGTLTLTSATDISNFLAAKGVGLVPSSQDSSHYSVCSSNCKVKITYTD